MKTKIQIKSVFGKVLFEYEEENNSIKKTVLEAIKNDADLSYANLSYADLSDADLSYANLSDADLSYANLSYADLSYANLSYANLSGADLSDANLSGADLSDANFSDANLSDANLNYADLSGVDLRGAEYIDVKIKKAQVFTGLYKYLVMPIIDENNEQWVRLGCFFRKVSEWEEDFWNNDREFPNDGSLDSQLRLMAYETAKKWIELNKIELGTSNRRIP